jgi:hypothetical protein
MTSHELARALLAGPDLPVLVPVDYDAMGVWEPVDVPTVARSIPPEDRFLGLTNWGYWLLLEEHDVRGQQVITL